MVTITLTDAQASALHLALDAFVDCTTKDGNLLRSIQDALPEPVDTDLEVIVNDDADEWDHSLVLFRPSEDVPV